MKSISFKSWLFRQHKRNDRVGDLARDFRADYRMRRYNEALPGRFTFRTALEYLQAVNACDGALDSLEAAHREWQVDRERRRGV